MILFPRAPTLDRVAGLVNRTNNLYLFFFFSCPFVIIPRHCRIYAISEKKTAHCDLEFGWE
jgi:hypothetical protein